MMRRIVALAGLVLALQSPVSAQSPERFTVAGSRVAVYNLVGSISVGPGTGSSVTVEVTRQGADGSQLRVETGPIEGRETLRVIYPEDDIVYSDQNWNGRSEMYVRDDGTFGGGDGYTTVDFGDATQVFHVGPASCGALVKYAPSVFQPPACSGVNRSGSSKMRVVCGGGTCLAESSCSGPRPRSLRKP